MDPLYHPSKNISSQILMKEIFFNIKRTKNKQNKTKKGQDRGSIPINMEGAKKKLGSVHCA